MQLRGLQHSVLGLVAGLWMAGGWAARADEILAPASERFAAAEIAEIPSFQRHVAPLFGRLGCSGRACHGSFQGQGGFRLSLFGYDFQADYDALRDKDHPRINLDQPGESLIITKPTDSDIHGGGLRYEKGSWQHHLLRRWIDAGALFSSGDVRKIVGLEVRPSELLFQRAGEETQLQVVAVWDDGSREDVTCLSRFQTNDEQVAAVDETGRVVAAERGDTHVVVFYDNAVVPVPVLRPVSELTGDRFPPTPAPTRVDELVLDKLRKLGVVPSDVCGDTEFLRRVRLDMTATLPTPDEIAAFVADDRPDKRARKIDELLTTPTYAAWWTTRLCDWTGNNADVLNNVGPVRGRESQYWYDWIYRRVADNVRYDEIAAGIVLATSRQSPETYTDFCRAMSDLSRQGSEGNFGDRQFMPYFWARNNLRLPEEKAIGFAYSFLGVRIECAQCHKHPFDQWSKQDFDDFKSLFTRVAFANTAAPDARGEFQQILTDLGLKEQRGNNLQRELGKCLEQGKTVPFAEVYVVPASFSRGGGRNPRRAGGDTGRVARLLGGEPLQLNHLADPREPLLAWLRSADNPYFARALVNRVWANYFNVGIVEPPDDMNLANPPSNRPLLDYLARGFVEHGYDLKWLHREITNSRTYQLSWIANATNELDERNFSRAVPRRLPAEVVYDAVQQATASGERLRVMQSSLEGRAIAMASAGARAATGPQYALRVFGRSIRESNCDCDRSAEPSLLQTVFLQNDREMLAMIDRRPDGWLAQIERESDPADLVRQAYLRTLSREPSVQEMGLARQHLGQNADLVDGLREVLWALLNTKEFIVNH